MATLNGTASETGVAIAAIAPKSKRSTSKRFWSVWTFESKTRRIQLVSQSRKAKKLTGPGSLLYNSMGQLISLGVPCRARGFNYSPVSRTTATVVWPLKSSAESRCRLSRDSSLTINTAEKQRFSKIDSFKSLQYEIRAFCFGLISFDSILVVCLPTRCRVFCIVPIKRWKLTAIAKVR